jgi:death-on-curing protein
MIDLFGGMPGIKDENMLESAISAPKAMMFGEFLHRSIHEMAAAYMFSLANNHGFHDGNKRTAAHAVNTFYLMNGYRLVVEVDQLVEFTVSVARDKPSKKAIADFLEVHVIKYSDLESES